MSKRKTVNQKNNRAAFTLGEDDEAVTRYRSLWRLFSDQEARRTLRALWRVRS